VRYALFMFLGLSLLAINNTAALSVAPVCLTAQGSHVADIAMGSNGERVEKMMAAQGHQRRRASPSTVKPRPAVRPVEEQPTRHTLLFGLWLACQFVGFFLASYGVLRESFANLAQERGFGEGRYGEGTFGGVLSRSEQFLVNLGTKVRFLPADRALTLEDRKRNAAWAIGGITLIALSMLFDLALRLSAR
jgi:hypothetical protein